MQEPIFIFSLPRSGSTLLQRVLMSNSEICSVAEPWVLLPQMYSLKEEGSLSEYSTLTSYWAIQDFINNLPNQKADYYESLRNFVLDLYGKQCQNGERYFLDKTPRYYLIIDDIARLFPKAKLIFLFRNPVHIYASAISTWGNNRFNKIRSTYNDIIHGSTLISSGYKKHKERSIAIRYEDFVQNPNKALESLSNYLEIDINPSILNEFSSQDTKGSLGDPSGVVEYQSISSESLNKWKNIFNSYVRKSLVLSVLKKINTEDLNEQGYDKVQIIRDVKSLNNKKNHLVFLDLFDYFTDYCVRKLNLHLKFSKNFAWVKKTFLS